MAFSPNQNPLPQIPIDPGDWNGMRNYLEALGQLFNVQDRDPTPPALVTGVTLTPVYPGIVIAWTPAIKAHSYILYRNIEPIFQTANPTTQLFGNSNVSFFDVTQGLASTTVVYYWVVAVNAIGIYGPVSGIVSTANSVPPAGGLVPNQNNPTVFQVADFDEIGDALAVITLGSLDASNDTALWAYIEGDDNYWSTSDYGGYSIH